jgi:thiol-disulfide isomerase/thioredoxin
MPSADTIDSILNYAMKIRKCLPFVLFLTVSAAQPADVEFAGVGVELGVEGQNIVVKRILPDTPAAAQKDLHSGDRIVAVAQGDEPAVEAQNLAQTARSMRGPKGTTVRLTIIPAGEDSSHVRVVSFVRGEVKGLWGDGVLLSAGTKAPDIEMVEVANKTTERLSNYAGKIIILDFWASWCGPCQPRIAELQTYPAKHPDWQTNVVLIAASIDENAEIAAKHLKAKGWNQTHNVWVELPAIRAYHISGIPTLYVIGRQGKVAAMNPRDLSQVVNHELDEERAPDAR